MFLSNSFTLNGYHSDYTPTCHLQDKKRGNCGHAMASLDGHSFCARCREKGKGKTPVLNLLLQTVSFIALIHLT